MSENPIPMNMLGDGPLHQELARQLGLGITTRPDSAGTPLVVVAEQPSDVQAILRARAWLPIAAIIAWRLPESALMRLLDLDLPVFVGLTPPEQFAAVLSRPLNPEAVATERRRTARLAAIEAAFTTRGRADDALNPVGATP